MARRVVELPSYSPIWNRYVSIYQKAFTCALERLALEKKIWQDESEITEFLALLLNAVCFEIRRDFPEEIKTPYWEVPIQPKSKKELTGGKTPKRPDFTCNIYNPFAERPEFGEIPLHIECKLLGKPTSPTWILNRNYVANGVVRFDARTHCYGKRASTGMMIGYMINMTPIQILSEVNTNLNTISHHYPPLQFQFGPTVTTCVQSLHRSVVMPYRFDLIHLWVDLR